MIMIRLIRNVIHKKASVLYILLTDRIYKYPACNLADEIIYALHIVLQLPMQSKQDYIVSLNKNNTKIIFSEELE